MTIGPLQILAPLLLAGLLAVGIPVLLHLLAKVRAPQVYFPTLRFLRSSMEKTARRRRVQHWLLLLLRMLALAVLVLAVCQPLIRAASRSLGTDRDTAVVVIIDNSVSMQVDAGGRSKLEASRDAALKMLKDRQFQKAAVVVTNGRAARTPPEKLADRFGAIEQVKAVAPGAGRADLAAAVATADQLLAAADEPNREIYIFSDLQEVSTRGIEAMHPTGESAPHLLVVTPPRPDGDAGPVNIAVTDLAVAQPDLLAGQRISLDATVRNFSHLAQKVYVRLHLDGVEQTNKTQVLNLAAGRDAGAARHVTFTFAFARPGPHHGRVSVERATESELAGGDDLPADDERHFALTLADRVDVLLVKQRHNLDAAADAGHMLRRLLSVKLPALGDTPVRLTEILADEFAPTLLSGAEVVITSDLAGLTETQAEALHRFAERGGTWMIWLGPSADVNATNQALGPDGVDVLGGRLTGYRGSGARGADIGQEPVFVQWVAEDHPMFRGLYADLSPWRKVLVYRHATLQRRSDAPGRVLARLNTGDPLVIETPAGAGRVVAFLTAAMPRWTTWLHQGEGQMFAVYQLVLASATRGRGLGSANRNENEAVRLEFPASAVPAAGMDGAAARVSIDLPGKGVVDAPVTLTRGEDDAAATAVATFDATDRLGLYAWQLQSAEMGAPRGHFVVNPPADESDLAALPDADLPNLMPGRLVLVGDSMEDLVTQIEQHRRGSPIWPYLLALAIVLLAVEAKIANRGRPSEGPGLRPVIGGRESAATTS